MLSINRERLQRMLEDVSAIGRDVSKGQGLYRIALSENDIKGRDYILSVLKEHALAIHVDGALNIHGMDLPWR